MEKDQNLLTVYGLLERAVSANGDKEAIYDLKRRVSYHEMKKDVERFAGTLYNLGIKKWTGLLCHCPTGMKQRLYFLLQPKLGR